MHILDSKRFYEALKKKGYRSIGEFAGSLGIHRNTVYHYLSGHGVFPENFEKIIRALDLRPRDTLIDKDNEAITSPLEYIAPLVDGLHLEFPNVTFILFGSRSGGTAQKYSDWDIGVFAAEGLPHDIFRKISRRKDDLAENLPFFVDLINLNRADDDFLRQASHHWMFLAGRVNDWIDIQRKAAA